MTPTTRRELVQFFAGALAAGIAAPDVFAEGEESKFSESFEAHQNLRRKELWSLLGDLPLQKKPVTSRIVSTEKHDGYTLQRITLDLNGFEAVPALLLIPDKRQSPAPGLLYIHWHGGMYDLGKEQLLTRSQRMRQCVWKRAW